MWGLLVLLQTAALLMAAVACEQRRPPQPEPGPAPPALVTPRITSTDEDNNIQIFKQAAPAVVFITNNLLRRDLLTLNVFEIPQGSGSGIVWNRQGYVVTNSHVVEGAASVSVGIIGTEPTYKARLVGLAPALDLAVLRIEAPPEQLNPLPLGDSSQLQVGQKVLAIGNPFGLDSTLTTGIISALGREISAPNGRRIRDVIQTDAAINPGNSGGPLLDSSGRVVGINTAIIGPGGGSAGIGFAVPINSVVKVVPQLIEHGRVIRPVLGVSVVADRIASDLGIEGAIVLSVARGSPASEAGLRGVQRAPDGQIVINDVIVQLDEFPVADSDDLLNALEHYEPGDVVTVKARRRTKELTFQVRLSEPE